jgi:thiol-disulfide isomerase/thioredoxin
MTKGDSTLGAPGLLRWRVRTFRCAAALLVLVAAGCSTAPNPASAAGSQPTADAPVVRLLKDPAALSAFSITDLDGKVLNSSALHGKVVLVNFWATWCPPCRAEIPDLIRLQDKYRDTLVIVGISEDELPAEQVKAFATGQKMNYAVAMSTPELKKIFRGVAALPTTFVIDRDGKLVQKHVGMLNPSETELEAQVLAGMNVNARIERVEDVDRARLVNAAQATEIPGVDLTKMTPQKRTEAIKAMNADNCTCGCDLTIAECRINDPTCSVSLPLAQELAKKIAKAN